MQNILNKFFLSTLLAFLVISARGQNSKAGYPDIYNVVWNSQSQNSGESMPCGGFDTGANIWVENNEVIMYIDRSGSFDENNQMLKLGRFRFSFSENPFKTKFVQKLDLKKGNVRIEGDNQFAMVVWFDISMPVCRIVIDSKTPIEVKAQYESWRTEERELKYGVFDGERIAAASYVAYPGKVITYPDVVKQEEKNSVLFYHRNKNDHLLFDFLVNQQKLLSIKDQMMNPQKDLTFGGRFFGEDCISAPVNSGLYATIPYKAYPLISKLKRSHRFYICLNTEQAADINDWTQYLEKLCQAALTDKQAQAKTEEWWNNFWNRSHININPSKDITDIGYQMSRNYTLFRYLLACNAYGSYPTKFNGGLFITDACYSVGEGQTFLAADTNQHWGKTPDFRMWGGGSFTAQNQRLVYWPMLKNGDFDMMPSQFNFYNHLLKNAELRTKTYWGHEGSSFTEQLENIGLPIAWNYGFEDTESKPWLRPKDFDVAEIICPSNKYHYYTQLEFAYMMVKYYRYTGNDISEYIPFIKSCVAFYFEHYEQIHQKVTTYLYDETGKLVIYPSTGLETYKDALNPTDAVSGLRGLVGELTRLPEYVDTAYYEKQYAKLPEIKLGEIDGKCAIMPAYSWSRIHNVELPQLYPVFPYEIFGLGMDNLECGINTWKTAPVNQKDYISWHQDGIFTARLGLTEEAKKINSLKLKDSGRRFPAFWGPGHDWVPDHNWGGSGMIGLQEMLMQTPGNKIILLPAWPKEWDVDFKLHAPENTIIECYFKDGKITSLKVTPESRKKDVVMPRL